MKKVYLILSIVGAVVPCIFFIQYFSIVGFGIEDFITALFVNHATVGFAVDLAISSLVLWVFIFSEAKVKKPWVFIIINIIIGLSCALPLYLYFRKENKSV